MGDRGLPVGSVSFLFSDIEGSTRLLQTLGQEAFAAALTEHHELVRSVVGNHEVSTEGDSFFCVFESPPEAVEAAAAVQRALQSHDWPDGAELRVRMGVHSGQGVLGGDNYVGLDVHRASRVAAAAHGGQVLLSDATRALVEHALPGAISLRDLGEHRLKDLAQPERLYQLLIEGLRADFPPPNSIAAARMHLPEQLTSFVGREAELEVILEALATSRLVTLNGIGGSGKTRLAIEAGRAAQGRHGGGVFFVPLSNATDAAMVAKAAADELSLAEQVGRPIEATIIDYLASRDELLILDNCEHVADATAALVESLLVHCPLLTILVTSREALLIAGERLVTVGPMLVPDAEDTASALATDAVRLFVERATDAAPGFDATRWAGECAQICRRLEGIPLAIELAAARTAMLGPADILRRLEDRFGLLTSRSRSVDARHETLEAAIDWSYDLLTEEAQRLLRWLAVFRGGFTLEAAREVCFDGDVAETQVLDLLTELSDKSLLAREIGFSQTRFRLLETIREYASLRLHRTGEYEAARAQHRDFYFSVAGEQIRRVGGPEQLDALDLLEADHDNFRAVIRRALAAHEVDTAADMAGRLTWFWYVHAHFSEGEEWATRLLHAVPDDPGRPWLRLLIGSAQYDFRTAKYERAEEKLRIALRATGEIPRLRMWTHAYLATTDMYRMHLEDALPEARRAIEVAEAERDLIGLGYNTYLLISIESLLALTRNELSPDRARELAKRLSPVSQGARTSGERNMTGHVLQSEGMLSARAGDQTLAVAALDTAIKALAELGTVGCVCHCLEAIADFASSADRHRDAVRLIAAADQLRDEVGITIAPMEAVLRAGAIARYEAALGAEASVAEREAGSLFSLAEAAQFARQTLVGV